MTNNKELIKNNSIDFIIRGEAETTIVDLVNSLEKKKSLKDVLGLTYKEGKKVLINEDRPLIKNINELPLPDRDAIDMKFYMANSKINFYYALNFPAASIISSRGCPYNCIFCSTKTMWRRHWRPKNAVNTFKEIKELYEKYGAREIVFYDDSFIVDKKRVKELCELIIKSKIKIKLNAISGLTVWTLDKELLTIMKKAGFYRLGFPIETGSENTLRFIRKPVDLKKTKEIISIANKLGFWTTANFIIGFPYETKKDIEKTINYACNCGIDFAVFFVAQPYAGAELYDIYKKEGLLKKDVHDAQLTSSFYPSKRFDSKQLNDFATKARKKFSKIRIKNLLNPIFVYNNILPKFKDPKNIAFVIKKGSSYLKSILSMKHE